jgi:hypothetical protein
MIFVFIHIPGAIQGVVRVRVNVINIVLLVSLGRGRGEYIKEFIIFVYY